MLKNNVESSYGFHESTPEFERLLKSFETISTEGFNGNRVIANAKDAFRFMTTWDYSKPEVINASQVESTLKRVMYTDMDELRVNVPVGFTGNMKAYIDHLQRMPIEYMAALSSELLYEVESHFARYIASPDAVRDRTVHVLKSRFTPELLAELIKTEASWTKSGSRHVEKDYTAIFNNNRECIESMQGINLINKKRWSEANPDKVRESNTRVLKVVEALFKQLQDSDVKANPAQVQHMAAVLQNAAKWVEWYSVMATRIMDTTAALKLTEKKLLRAF